MTSSRFAFDDAHIWLILQILDELIRERAVIFGNTMKSVVLKIQQRTERKASSPKAIGHLESRELASASVNAIANKIRTCSQHVKSQYMDLYEPIHKKNFKEGGPRPSARPYLLFLCGSAVLNIERVIQSETQNNSFGNRLTHEDVTKRIARFSLQKDQQQVVDYSEPAECQLNGPNPSAPPVSDGCSELSSARTVSPIPSIDFRETPQCKCSTLRRVAATEADIGEQEVRDSMNNVVSRTQLLFSQHFNLETKTLAPFRNELSQLLTQSMPDTTMRLTGVTNNMEMHRRLIQSFVILNSKQIFPEWLFCAAMLMAFIHELVLSSDLLPQLGFTSSDSAEMLLFEKHLENEGKNMRPR